eukprot:TRINITY_DN48925_c0_g1_i1.p1 TRINITY_DN48925_c0_g1~~TRINITY_DN48925_c0_g1_i1.p1  ORF type:complete len:354 (+),score=41.01 TRINITY_DN48925_c0_g1_i1:156-1217(+)
MIMVIISVVVALLGIACPFFMLSRMKRRTEGLANFHRYICALAAVFAAVSGFIGLLWCFVSPPPFSRPLSGPPAVHRNDPTRSLYFGNGCFWHTQYDFVMLEQKHGGVFGNRSDEAVTSLVGYAGGDYQSASGSVCYHGWPGTDYGRLGHAEAVSVALDAASGAVAQAQVTELARIYFDHGFETVDGGKRLRLDPSDKGPEYRNVIGLPGGKGNGELWPLIEAANVHSMPLVNGGGGPHDDKEDNFVVYVYDSTAHPFFRGETSHQFHANTVIGRPVPSSYTINLKEIQKREGRLDNIGCIELPFAEVTLLIVFVFAFLFAFGCIILHLLFPCGVQCWKLTRSLCSSGPQGHE